MALQPFGCGLIGPKVKELTMPGGVFFGLHLLGCDLDAASSLWWLPRIDYRNQGDTLGLHRLGMHLLPHFEVHAGGTECLTARTSSPLPPLLGWLGWRPFTLHLFWCGRRLFGTHMPVGARAHQSSRVAHAPVSMVACWSGGCCSRPTSGCRSSPHRRGMLIHRPQTPRSGGWVGMVLPWLGWAWCFSAWRLFGGPNPHSTPRSSTDWQDLRPSSVDSTPKDV